MSIITDTWHQLARRRLLPVAVLLLVAIAAVPFLLAKDPAPVASEPATVTPVDTARDAIGEPVVALAADPTGGRRRRVLGARKDPFEPAPAPRQKASESAAANPPANSGGGTAAPDTPGTPPPSGSSGTPGGTGSSPDTPAKTFPANSLTVAYGTVATDKLPKRTLERLQPLMNDSDPIVVYLGLRNGGKEAVFLVDASVTAQGDGRCESGASDCETLVLRAGETEFLDVTDETGDVTAQYELDVLAIHAGKASAKASKAAAARKAAALGRRAVDAHIASSGPLRYRYDARTGRVVRLDAAGFKAAVDDALASAPGVTRLLAGL
jgi:hypothetical protein